VGDLVGLRHVRARVKGPDPELALDPGALPLDRVRLAEAVQDDVGALPGERAGDAEADAAG
jgi:hypothetical protein